MSPEETKAYDKACLKHFIIGETIGESSIHSLGVWFEAVSFAEKRLLERVGKCEGCRNEDTCKASNIVPCHVFKFKWMPKEVK